MSEEKKSEVARKLELLKLRFKEKATTEIGLLQGAVERFRAGDYCASDITSVYHSLHRLSGSAGTFGFAALGEEARSLERLVKPLADTDDGLPERGLTTAQVREVVNEAFVSRVANLASLVSQEQGAPKPHDPSSPLIFGNKTEDSVVLIVDPEPDSARDLTCGLEHYGFLVNVFSSIESALANGAAGVSALVVRDELVIRESGILDALAVKPPIICIGAEDSFTGRYALAERGVDGFVCEPVDIPVLADYMERLITERDEGRSGRVMIVDDDPELLEHYGLVLENGGMEVRRVNNPAQILSVLSEFRPDIMLMDVQMGQFSGLNLARMLRFDPEWLGLPIIYLSSEEDREFQVEALSQGGDDFLTKPVSDRFLLRAVAVRCYRARQRDKLASRDSLTGLLKHSLAKSEIHKEHARCTRLGQTSVVAMLDLDHFKQVNDRYGHRTGDLVIKGLANLLRHRLRKSDMIGRYGGEEFVVALPDCSVEDAQRVLQSVCDHMSGIVFSGGGREFSVTLSVGMAPLGDFRTSDDALEAADQALYRRKQSGRNGVTVSGDEPETVGTVS
ncbi:diguanylate cyclase [Marinobacter sp. M216]|uniref:diguanylate cyclase n=1 Tax=Marinobacter albus TaxID=3030833 RepID=A0ABT7H7B4_9GAMM|nr:MULTISPECIES: diguanylate cyclase [unclassified Marinobacter]MBW7471464.1 diguanylate cyclase [Marinobacter sp. F4218]MDK9556258.1 diguanylate cyclase [Marinobacter sp. M216]